MYLYADDSKFCRSIQSDYDCRLLQSDASLVAKWCRSWKLNLNIDKCNIITFSRKTKSKVIDYTYKLDKQPIKRVQVVKDLGVYLTHNLSFSQHINHIIKRSFQMLGFIRRICSNFDNVQTLRTLYISYVRSNLEYCSVVWSSHQNYLSQKIERVQKKFIKYMCVKQGYVYESDRYSEL